MEGIRIEIEMNEPFGWLEVENLYWSKWSGIAFIQF